METVFAAVAAVAAAVAVVMTFITVRQNRQAQRDARHLRRVEYLERVSTLLVALNDQSYMLPTMQARLRAALAALEALDGPPLTATRSFAASKISSVDISAETVVPYLREVEQSYEALDRDL